MVFILNYYINDQVNVESLKNNALTIALKSEHKSSTFRYYCFGNN